MESFSVWICTIKPQCTWEAREEILLKLRSNNFHRVTNHESNKKPDLAYGVLVIAGDKTQREKKRYKKIKKKEANCLLFSAIKKVELFMANGGNLCYKKAINKMSALLLTVTFSIQGLLRRLDWRHNFIKNYNQNHTHSWECSLFSNARRYLAPPTFYSTATNLVNHSLGWCILFLIGSAVPGAIFVDNLWLQMYDVEGMALAPLS